MNLLSTCKPSPAAVVGVTLLALGVGTPVTAATLSPAPLYSQVAKYSIQIPNLIGPPDAADVYYPVVSAPGTASFPIALFLQGALIDKSEYSNFARIVASYGFGVVVPNHTRAAGPFPPGFFPQQEQVNTVLDRMTVENSDVASPVAGLLDVNKMVLLGHSFGGAVGLAAIQGDCVPSLGLCTGSYQRPTALVGGAFYGTSFFDPRFGNTAPPINNDGIPVALIAGSRDGVTDLPDVEETYKQIQDPTKALITVEGANHYSITNQDNPFREPNRATLDQAVATETIARWSALFLRATVLDDPEAYKYVFQTGDALDSNVTVVSERVPEPTAVIGLLGLGVIGVITRFKRQQRVK